MERSRAGEPNAGMGPSIFDIPNYVLMEILSKLPLTAICYCRRVCTYFRDLISDPLFSQFHLSKSHPCLILRSNYATGLNLLLVESIDSCVIEGRINDDVLIPDNTLFKFEPNCDAPTYGLEVLSSCNGLICFYCPRSYKPYVICNPVMNEYVIVPQIEKGFFDPYGSGFGLCPGTNQYKVLRFLSPSRLGVTGLTKLEAEINTVGSNLWRRVGDAPRYLHWYSRGCFLNGALHWIVHNTENCFESMCCFDFGKERFQPLPGPSQFLSNPGLWYRVDMMNMGVLKDCLSIFHQPCNYKLDIWVMKDYAVMESWTKEFVLELPWVEILLGFVYQPLRVLNNGEILVVYASSVLLSFSTRDGSFRKVRVNGIRSGIRTMTYIPSFVSINNAATGSMGYS